MLPENKRLKKELSLLSVYAIATGATLSSGFFLLPGIAAAEAGPAMILSYILAAIPMIPAVLSMAELSSAMPRAGGVYYFMDRSIGPLWGTIGGMGTWLALTLKTGFALVGMGAYLTLFLPEIPMMPLAIAFALFLGIVNFFGAKKSGSFQAALVFLLLTILIGFKGFGATKIDLQHFDNFFQEGFEAIVGTAGLVFVSYVGVTKIASVSEEVSNPEKNLPLSMLLALITAIIIYALGTFVMVGVLPAKELYGNLTPVAATAEKIIGNWGSIVMSIAAMIAFLSVANAGILSASRYPLAMSRDHLLAATFRKLSKHGTPQNSIFLTVGMIIVWVVIFDPTKIAKLASGFQLLLCAFSCLAVIVMRESRIESYDPGYRSPFYPWAQIVGIVLCYTLMGEMGWLPIMFTFGLIAAGTGWYFYYAKDKVVRDGAIYHIFARLGERRFEGLDRELRGILKEKGLREDDPFDILVARASVIDFKGKATFVEIIQHAVALLSQRLPASAEYMEERIMHGTRIGATPVAHGAALPHLRLPDIKQPEMVIVRIKAGVSVNFGNDCPDVLDDQVLNEPIFAFFFLVSPDHDPGRHLRILAEIAERIDDDGFLDDWLSAKNEHELKKILISDECFLLLKLRENTKSTVLIGKEIRDMILPDGCLIALVRRQRQIIIPRGNTVLQKGDRLTIFGDPVGIQQLAEQYGHDGAL